MTAHWGRTPRHRPQGEPRNTVSSAVLCGGYQALEHAQIGVDLGVPLHARREAVTARLDRLDSAVRDAPADGGEDAGIGYRLVVQRVDLDYSADEVVAERT